MVAVSIVVGVLALMGTFVRSLRGIIRAVLFAVFVWAFWPLVTKSVDLGSIFLDFLRDYPWIFLIIVFAFIFSLLIGRTKVKTKYISVEGRQ